MRTPTSQNALLRKDILPACGSLLKTARARKRPRGFESHALRSVAAETLAAQGNLVRCE